LSLLTVVFFSPSLQTILYGAESSTLFPGQTWGGMTADTAIYAQAGLDLPTLLAKWDAANESQWRIFSKLGECVPMQNLSLLCTCSLPC